MQSLIIDWPIADGIRRPLDQEDWAAGRHLKRMGGNRIGRDRFELVLGFDQRRVVLDLQQESKMRLATLLALALSVAVTAPSAAVASERVTGMHEHRVHMHHVLRGSFKAATALAPPFAIVPTAPAATYDHDKYDGLSRDSDDCNYGCIDNGH